MSTLPTNASESTKKLNPHLWPHVPGVGTQARGGIPDSPCPSGQICKGASKANPKRIRQRTKPRLNKLETQWLNELTTRYPGDRIRAQAIRFELANGVMYTPDITRSNDRFKAYEVKGPHAWDDAIVKLKVAARSYPEIDWVLVGKDKHGQWQEQKVLP